MVTALLTSLPVCTTWVVRSSLWSFSVALSPIEVRSSGRMTSTVLQRSVGPASLQVSAAIWRVALSVAPSTLTIRSSTSSSTG